MMKKFLLKLLGGGDALHPHLGDKHSCASTSTTQQQARSADRHCHDDAAAYAILQFLLRGNFAAAGHYF
jgi:hypothetical protein